MFSKVSKVTKRMILRSSSEAEDNATLTHLSSSFFLAVVDSNSFLAAPLFWRCLLLFRLRLDSHDLDPDAEEDSDERLFTLFDPGLLLKRTV